MTSSEITTPTKAPEIAPPVTPPKEKPAPGPVRVTVTICRPEGEIDEEHTVKYASNHGDRNGYCHWFITRNHTICGQFRDPALTKDQLHTERPCPNGNPPCERCVEIYARARYEQYGDS